MKLLHTLCSLFIVYCLLSVVGCANNHDDNNVNETFLLHDVGYPQGIFHEGKYYFTFQSLGGDSVELLCTDQLENIANAQRRTIWSTPRDSMTHFWSPDIYRVQDKWYLYFEGDDGNTDNHHLFVMECEDNDPMTGCFTMKGLIETHAEWNYGIHPNLLQLPSPGEGPGVGGLYLLWSGWPERRTETETQCIYIARMENPWTLSSERVMISKPEYEWERQWINPDGTRSAYPIYVNENPEAFVTPDGQHVIVLYSASGIWTEYTAMGMLTAPVTADLLDPTVWTKHPEPMIEADTTNFICITDVYLISVPSTSVGGDLQSVGGDLQSPTMMVYEKKRREQGNIVRDTYMRPLRWTKEGLPEWSRSEDQP